MKKILLGLLIPTGVWAADCETLIKCQKIAKPCTLYEATYGRSTAFFIYKNLFTKLCTDRRGQTTESGPFESSPITQSFYGKNVLEPMDQCQTKIQMLLICSEN